MNALTLLSVAGDFGPDRLSPRRLRELARVLEGIVEVGIVEFPDFLRRQEDRDKLHDQLAEASRALDALAETMVRAEAPR
jgi:hypothetical protein